MGTQPLIEINNMGKEKHLILIEDSGMDILQAQSHNDLRSMATRTDSGEWLINVDSEVRGFLEKERFSGESFNDCIIRIVATSGRKIN